MTQALTSLQMARTRKAALIFGIKNCFPLHSLAHFVVGLPQTTFPTLCNTISPSGQYFDTSSLTSLSKPWAASSVIRSREKPFVEWNDST